MQPEKQSLVGTQKGNAVCISATQSVRSTVGNVGSFAHAVSQLALHVFAPSVVVLIQTASQ
jgi:hypothetical protein